MEHPSELHTDEVVNLPHIAKPSYQGVVAGDAFTPCQSTVIHGPVGLGKGTYPCQDFLVGE